MNRHLEKLKVNLFANNSTRQTIAKNSFWLLLAEGGSKGILFLVTILIARSFSVEEYGIFGFIFSVMTLISMVADFGLANVIIRELAKKSHESADYFDKAFSLKIILSVISLLFMVAATFFLSRDLRTPAILAGVAILLEGMTDYVRISFRVSEHAQYEVVIKIAAAMTLICLVSGIILLKLTLTHILFGFIIAQLFGLLLAMRLLNRRLTVSVSAANLKPLLVESWPMFLGLICTSAYGQIDLILIRAFRGFAEAGLYQAAYKLMFGFQLLRVVHMAMYPRLAAFHAERNVPGYRRLMQKSIFWGFLVLIPPGIVALLFPEEIIMLFFGKEYVVAAIALPFLVWSGILSFIASFFSYTLMVAGRQRVWLFLEFIVLVMLIIIEVSLIPAIGFKGAAVATFAGEAVFLCLIISWIAADSGLRELFFSGDQKEC